MENLYLNIEKEKQRKLVEILKQKAGFSWTQLARFLGVTRGMTINYHTGKCRMPFEKIKMLFKLTKTSWTKFDLKFIEVKNKPKNPVISEFDEDFAEFLGLLYGDGCLSKHGNVIHVTCNAVSDRKYVEETVKPKFVKLFSLEPKIIINESWIRCRLYSKKVSEFLSNTFEIPIGKKKGKMKIPKIIYSNPVYYKAFLRGLFDTDGGFHRHHKNSAQIHFTSADENFLKETWKLLLKLGFNAKLGKEDIWILDSVEIDKFFKEINPHNPKHIYKYKKYKKTGIVPLHREIDYAKLFGVCDRRESNPAPKLGKLRS